MAPCFPHYSAWLLLCMSLPGQLGLSQLPGLCLGWLSLTTNLLPALAAPCCCPLSSARCGAGLLTPLSVLCLSAAFTREGMPVSTFLRLILPSNPFFHVSCHPAGLFCCCKIQMGWGQLGVDVLLVLGGICFRKSREETVGAVCILA